MIKLINISKGILYILIIFLLINYLFPGSLMGYFIFGDLGRQLSLADNPIFQPIPHDYYFLGDLISHFIFFALISFGIFNFYLKNRKLKNLFYILLSFSIVLELLHFVIPNRSFQFLDIVANSIGIIFAYFIIIIYRFYNKRKT
jgi:hypothetical protein